MSCPAHTHYARDRHKQKRRQRKVITWPREMKHTHLQQVRGHTPRLSLHMHTRKTLSARKLLKGTVHPKKKILSSFTLPQVDPNLYECVCSEHKGRYSEEWGTQSSIFFLLWKSMVPQNSLITNFHQNIFLCVQNKHIHTGLDLLEIIFGCTVPLRRESAPC